MRALMYDELVKRLWECVSSECWDCSQKADDYEGQRTCADKLMKQAADAIEELSEQLENETEYATALNSYVPQWIPVTERLPEEEKTVLTWGKEHQCILLDWMHDNKWCCFGDADYWMPLPPSPEPPKEET